MIETIIVRVIDAPPAFRGCVKRDADGNVNLYLNGSLSDEERKRTIMHELAHLVFGHLDDDTKTVEEKENECSNLCAV